ncbi:MAG: hypothetical protein QM534_00460 [Sediminibacterium sp.]|nr:hypothetical protein [Sediminibacterium sp.]
MIRKDYLIRQFEEFGKFMAIILGFRQQLKWQEHEEKVREALRQFTALELLTIEDLPNDQFFDNLFGAGTLSDEHIKITADLLFEKSHYYLHHQQTINAHNVLQKAAILYRYLTQAVTMNNYNLDAHFKLNSVERMLEQFS